MESNQPYPPKWADRLVEWVCKDEVQEIVQGDLHEQYFMHLEKSGKRKADRMYAKEVLTLLRPRLLKNLGGNYRLNCYGMFKNHIKIAWRSLGKQKMYSFIKIGGLAIGVAACILIGLYVMDELSYDQHVPEKDRIYRVALRYDFDDIHGYQMHFQAPYAKTLKSEIPEIEEAGRINTSSLFGAGSNEIRRSDSDRSIHQENVVFFDQELFRMLKPEMIEGTVESALNSPKSVVLSESVAKQYFPKGGAFGKTLIINEKIENPYVVGGVMEDFPSNSHLNFNVLITMTENSFYEDEQDNWNATNYYTYIMLSPEAKPEEILPKIEAAMTPYWVPIHEKFGLTEEQIPEVQSHYLQPITDIHLYSAAMNDGMVHGDIKLVWLFGGIAVFILLLAFINFINLSTAKSANRAKEVGLKKTLGSQKGNLISQFLTESTLYSLISLIAGLVVSWSVLPLFNEMAGKALSMPWMQWWLLPGILAGSLAIGLVAGLYPSFYLSAFRPIQILRGNLSHGSKNSTLRSSLVVFQFVTSIVLIIGTIVITRQMDFILNANVGFEKDQVILLNGANTLGDQVQSFKNELLRLPGVESVSTSDYLPVSGSAVKRNGNTFWEPGQRETERGITGQFWRVDEDYIHTMGMQIISGRDFSDSPDNNRQKAIINQRMADEFGFENPIGMVIENGKDWEIVGVVEDFHFQSFREKVDELCMVVSVNNPSVIAIKANTQDMSGLLSAVTDTWDDFSPNQIIRYSFLDDQFERMYADVERTKSIFTSFSLLAIIVACLGLFGLSSFMAEQRSKEISIRKVLGASTSSILGLLIANFLKLVGIAFVIAVPISIYAMREWLNGFEYRIDLAWWFFLMAGAVAAAIALLTVSRQALKVAMANPTRYLRKE